MLKHKSLQKNHLFQFKQEIRRFERPAERLSSAWERWKIRKLRYFNDSRVVRVWEVVSDGLQMSPDSDDHAFIE